MKENETKPTCFGTANGSSVKGDKADTFKEEGESIVAEEAVDHLRFQSAAHQHSHRAIYKWQRHFRMIMKAIGPEIDPLARASPLIGY